jgi:PKD repeat protein
VVYFDANSPEADWFEWNYGTNSNWYPSATGSPGTAFGSPGNYTVSVRLGLDDQGESCTTTSTHDIQIHPRPLASISLSQTEGCDAMTIEVEELHQAGESY